jgi:hypothetical protein
MKLVAYQPYFLPNRTYFDCLNKADVFVHYVDVQYIKRSWQNRNVIKSQKGTEWMTVPVRSKGRYLQFIKDVEICDDTPWNEIIIKKLEFNYTRAPYYAEYRDYFQKIFNIKWEKLCELNIRLIEDVCRLLKITHVNFLRSSELAIPANLEKSHRLLWLCKKLKAKTYVSGTGAKNYLNEKIFKENNIKVEWHETNPNNYPPYQQINGEFNAGVSIIDLLFNCGEKSSKYIISNVS